MAVSPDVRARILAAIAGRQDDSLEYAADDIDIDFEPNDLELFRARLHQPGVYITRDGLDYRGRLDLKLSARVFAAIDWLLVVAEVRYSAKGFDLLAEGEPADRRTAVSAIIPVLGSDGTLVDFCAWPIGKPDLFKLKFDVADGLGFWHIAAPRSSVVAIYVDPEDWLLGYCQGICLLRESAALQWLGGQPLAVGNDRLWHRLERLLGDAARIGVPDA
jgi:hypothetical protein